MNIQRAFVDEYVIPTFAYFETSAGPNGSQLSAGPVGSCRCNMQRVSSNGQNNSALCGRCGESTAISKQNGLVEPSINTNENNTTKMIDGWSARTPSGQHWPFAGPYSQRKQTRRGQNPSHARRVAQPAHCVSEIGGLGELSILENDRTLGLAFCQSISPQGTSGPLDNNRPHQEVHTWKIKHQNKTTRKRRRRRR